MVAECNFIYESGHKCRRIPRRGETLCPGHKVDARRFDDQAAAERQLTGYIHYLNTMPLKELLPATLQALAQIQPIVNRKSSRFHRAAFDRGRHALAITFDRLTHFFENRQDNFTFPAAPRANPPSFPVPPCETAPMLSSSTTSLNPALQSPFPAHPPRGRGVMPAPPVPIPADRPAPAFTRHPKWIAAQRILESGEKIPGELISKLCTDIIWVLDQYPAPGDEKNDDDDDIDI